MAAGGAMIEPLAGPAAASLLQEGLAMLRAVTADFVAAGCEVAVVLDQNLATSDLADCKLHFTTGAGDDRSTLSSLAACRDWTLLIAPEIDGLLLDRARLVERAGGRLLGPGPAFIEVASDKHHCLQHLSARGIACPRGWRLEIGDPPPLEMTWPAVIKPCDGAGSQGVLLAASAQDRALTHRKKISRLEEFCPGLPASVALLCGPAANFPLPACRQRLAGEGSFEYLGGELPLAVPLNERARRLAAAAIAELPPTVGYVGVDLVLGEATDGSNDRVIEINPRLTTSYVGLRAASATNLATAMLDAAVGRAVELRFRGERVQFTADGAILHHP